MSHILSLATKAAPHAILQKSLARKIAKISLLNEAQTKWLERIYANSAIEKRHSVIEDFCLEVDEWRFWNGTLAGTKRRNELYKQHAPQLAVASAKQALDEWGGSPADISHIIFVSCTGCIAPGIQSHLQKVFGLRPTVNQLGLNMMGCFGAFKGLDVAHSFANNNPKHRVLLVCTELCSLHFQQNDDPELQVANALFADGSAACVVGAEPQKGERPLWKLEQFASYKLPDSEEQMSWEVGDTGFLMGLKAEVPQQIEKHALSFIRTLVPEKVSFDECLWPIHPGGKNILQAVEKGLHLTKEQTKCSWHILKEYGNMSSPTFLFVLEEMKAIRTTLPYAIGLGFGPGLMFEGVRLKSEGANE